MNTLSIIFFILIGFIFGAFAGIVLAYLLVKWHDEERISAEDVDQWMKEETFYDN
ncbi:MAG: hypothetical protein V3V72_13480 [Ignavibacteriaceae bacterium]